MTHLTFSKSQVLLRIGSEHSDRACAALPHRHYRGLGLACKAIRFSRNRRETICLRTFKSAVSPRGRVTPNPYNGRQSGEPVGKMRGAAFSLVAPTNARIRPS
jgi:hypothetical protein